MGLRGGATGVGFEEVQRSEESRMQHFERRRAKTRGGKFRRAAGPKDPLGVCWAVNRKGGAGAGKCLAPGDGKCHCMPAALGSGQSDPLLARGEQGQRVSLSASGLP